MNWSLGVLFRNIEIVTISRIISQISMPMRETRCALVSC